MKVRLFVSGIQTRLTVKAHIIRNESATSRAVCSLKARYRWAVTGTPIQNHLMDLFGLLKFLKFRPYDDPNTLNKEIFDYIHRDKFEGIRRLKTLCHTIMIRRPASIIDLPPRQDLTKTVDFSQEEKWWYREIENSLQSRSDNAIETHAGDGSLWMSAIQMINKLRLCCNLGLASKPVALSVPQHSPYSTTPEQEDPTETIVASELSLGGKDCVGCGNIISIPDIVDKPDTTASAYYSKCRKLFCLSCASLYQNHTTPDCPCDSTVTCVLQPLPFYLVQRARDGPGGDSFNGSLSAPLSTKVEAVVEEIEKALPEKR